MLIMTSSSRIVSGEDEEEERTPSPRSCHLQSFSVEIKSDHENPECREDGGVCGVNLEEYFSCSSSVNNSYSFYLGSPPLQTEARSKVPRPRGEERRGRSVTRKRDLPPFLTTLDCNGRPRFHHRRVRSEGRLEIASVAVDSPEMVSVRGREGLRIGTVTSSQESEEEEENHSTCS